MSTGFGYDMILLSTRAQVDLALCPHAQEGPHADLITMRLHLGVTNIVVITVPRPPHDCHLEQTT